MSFDLAVVMEQGCEPFEHRADRGLVTEPRGEIQLRDVLAVLAQQGRLVGVRFSGERHDAGDRLGYLQANIAYALKRPELREPLLEYLRQVVKQ